jgi:hypothetical protein
MCYKGVVKGGVVVLEETARLPEGAQVRVELAAPDADQPAVWRRLLDLAEECAVEGPPDLAERHDHYAHGKP